MKLREYLRPVSLKDLAFIDFRALALFRICLGVVLFFDLLTKSLDLTAFYTDRGILSRTLAIQDLGWWSFSIHMASGAFWFQLVLMLLGFLLSLQLIVGYGTRLVTVLLWIFILSLQARNGLILHSGDALIRLMVFWSMFLPLDARWSIDRMYRSAQPSEARGLASIASFAILLQLLYMYFFTSLLKNHPDWNRDFTAIYYALNLTQFVTPLGQAMLNYPALLKFLTFGTYTLELVGPLLLLVPGLQRRIRWMVPFAFIGLHFSLFLTMYLGLFPWICMVAWILFFPSGLMDRIEALLLRFRGPSRASRLVQVLLPHLPVPPTWRRPLWLQRAVTGFLLICIAVITIWNIAPLPQANFKIPSLVRSIALPLRLDQHWSMFAPYPMRADGWFIVDGKLKDGSNYDTWNKMEPPWEMPADVFTLLRSTQWRKYLTNIWLGDERTDDNHLAFGRYICREWNDLSGDRPEGKQLQEFQLYYMRKDTPPPGEIPRFKKILLWNHNCFGEVKPTENEQPTRIRD